LSTDRPSYGGRYTVLQRVGSGGMAEVYRARDELLGREVAVKVLSERFARDRSFVERFRREAQSAANLNHPNIVSLYDYGADNGTYFIVMEMIEGRSLSDIIASDGPLMPERAAEIASDVAAALGRAHTSGLVHRDIKPSNIMITPTGQTKVTDFGIARAVGGDSEATMTQTGMVIGTAAYLSPEQAQGNPVDARSDVYALGVVLFEMLTGVAPFTGDTPLSVAYKHVREDPRAPSSLNPDVPQSLDSITLKALAKNLDNRYSTAEEMREDLQRYLGGQRVQATPLMAEPTTVAPAHGTRVLRETQVEEYEPEPKRAGLYVVVALLILGLIGILVWLFADQLFGGGAQVEVPDVVGMTASEARDELEEVGLEAEEELKNSQKPVNEVLRQDPEAGETAEEGDVVQLIVSGGARQVEVPDVVDIPVEEARALIEEADLEVGQETTEASDEVDEGIVLDQSPGPGEEVAVGSKVDLLVSGGPEVVVVPSVVNLPQEDAESNISAVGLVPAVETVADDAEAGTVIDQNPDGGSEAAVGDTVTITVSSGPEETELPDLTGEDAADAEALLESQFGLMVTLVEETEECFEASGTVCRTDPPAGSTVSEGDEVTIFFAP
jgi:eukaryotic-like serine/threonine-protein kinase